MFRAPESSRHRTQPVSQPAQIDNYYRRRRTMRQKPCESEKKSNNKRVYTSDMRLNLHFIALNVCYLVAAQWQRKYTIFAHKFRPLAALFNLSSEHNKTPMKSEFVCRLYAL